MDPTGPAKDNLDLSLRGPLGKVEGPGTPYHVYEPRLGETALCTEDTFLRAYRRLSRCSHTFVGATGALVVRAGW